MRVHPLKAPEEFYEYSEETKKIVEKRVVVEISIIDIFSKFLFPRFKFCYFVKQSSMRKI